MANEIRWRIPGRKVPMGARVNWEISGNTDQPPARGRLPLWLTRAEAEALAALACTSPLSPNGNEDVDEAGLFLRLGAFLQAFNRVTPATGAASTKAQGPGSAR